MFFLFWRLLSDLNKGDDAKPDRVDNKEQPLKAAPARLWIHPVFRPEEISIALFSQKFALIQIVELSNEMLVG